MPSSAPEVNTLLTIGELARRAGVSTSALRYYEELGLLPAPARISGQRRYPASAARVVGTILLYSDAGFTLAEQKVLMASRDDAGGEWSRVARRKLAELDEQIARAQAAREAIEHGLRCPNEDITRCPELRRRCHRPARRRAAVPVPPATARQHIRKINLHRFADHRLISLHSLPERVNR